MVKLPESGDEDGCRKVLHALPKRSLKAVLHTSAVQQGESFLKKVFWVLEASGAIHSEKVKHFASGTLMEFIDSRLYQEWRR